MKPSPKIVAGAVAVALVSLFPCAANAEPPLSSRSGPFPVVIIVPRCIKAPAPDLQRIASAELGIDVATQLEEDAPAAHDPTSGAPRSSATDDPEVTQVMIACAGPWVRLEVLDPVSGKTLVRHLDLAANDPATRTRLLGLSAAELVAASWIELTVHAAPRPHIVEAKASPSTREAAARAAQRALAEPPYHRLEAFASAQRTGSADLLTLGGGFGASWVRNGWQVVGADVLVESGSEDVSLGTIRTLLASASASLRIRQRLGWIAVEGGLGARGGLAYMQGEAAEITPRPDATTATLPWWGPMIMLRVEAAIAARVAFLVGLEAGRVIYAADGRAAGRTGSAIENQWVGLTLGPALTLGGAP
jgi:hypothetical protein